MPVTLHKVDASIYLMTLTLNIIKAYKPWRLEQSTSKKHIKIIVQKALDLFPELSFVKEIEVTLLLTNNEQMQDLNHQFRGKDKPTNVLSFSDTDIPYVRYSKENYLFQDELTELSLLQSPDSCPLRNDIEIKKDYLLEIDPGCDYINLGDIAFGYEIIVEEAKNQSKSFSDHFAHLLIHGVLHLLGFDHEKTYEAEIMEGLEIKALSNLAIASPY